MSEREFWLEELSEQNADKDKFIKHNMNRMIQVGICTIVIFLILIGRLFYIQVVKNQEYSQKAVQQRMVTIPLAINRGEIIDRNMIPFTDREIRKVVIAYPAYLQDVDAAAEAISRACDVNIKEVKHKISTTLDTVEFVAQNKSNDYLNLIESGRIKGVMTVEKQIRYSENGIANHVIGYISRSDLKGQTGIEKSMNRFLTGAGADSIVAVVDSGKNLIPGLGFRKVEGIKDNESYNIKLTLDYHMQSIAEEVLKSNDIEGAAVVMDTKNGDLLAMASTPDYDPNNISKYMNSSGNELINKAIWQFDFGSIFKTIVAAAALENNVIDQDQKYLCEGSLDVGNYTIKCSTYHSHSDREIDIKEAFALSCNTTFVKLGMQVGAENILNTAKELGFGEKQCSELLEEKPGYIPSAQEDGIGNISIGQGKIQVTPLQVTNLMATIANGGIMHSPVIVDALLDDNGNVIKKMERARPRVVLSYRTVAILRDMLSEVTKTGTGKEANMDEFGGSSGKTSSAETGIDSGEVVHGWFSGYVPSNAPQYAITVFVYNGRSGGKSAAPIFKEIASKILKECKR